MPLSESPLDLASKQLLLDREKELAAMHRSLASLRDRLRIEGRESAAECVDAALFRLGGAFGCLDDLS